MVGEWVMGMRGKGAGVGKGIEITEGNFRY